jgi:hypothetical protein
MSSPSTKRQSDSRRRFSLLSIERRKCGFHHRKASARVALKEHLHLFCVQLEIILEKSDRFDELMAASAAEGEGEEGEGGEEAPEEES